MKLSAEESDFLNYVKKECKKNNVNLNIKNQSSIGDDLLGYFTDGPPAELCVAKKPSKNNLWDRESEQFISTLAHEFCHLLQWHENSNVWYKTENSGIDMIDIINLWLAGKIELTKKQRHYYVKMIQNLELDCEKRTCKILKKFDIPIDIEMYIKQANFHLYAYSCMRDFRIWPTGSKNINIYKTIIHKMPNKFMTNYEEVPHGTKAKFVKIGKSYRK